MRSLPLLTVLLVSSAAFRRRRPMPGCRRAASKRCRTAGSAICRPGAGWSLALAAELNGYPGPLHVLELADRLGLSRGAARQSRSSCLNSMKAEAVSLGSKLIEQEAGELDRQFSGRTIAPESLQEHDGAICSDPGPAARDTSEVTHLSHTRAAGARSRSSNMRRCAAMPAMCRPGHHQRQHCARSWCGLPSSEDSDRSGDGYLGTGTRFHTFKDIVPAQRQSLPMLWPAALKAPLMRTTKRGFPGMG